MMQPQSVIVVSYDGVGCGYLGPYGSTWAATPALNELAARGRVFDFLFANSPDLESTARSWWSGRHPAQPHCPELALFSATRDAGIPSVVISDDADLCHGPVADQFDQRVALEASPSEIAPTLEETALCVAAAQAVDALIRMEAPFLAWVHLGSMARGWDVPMELRLQLVDETDPELPSFVDPPTGPYDDFDAVWANQLVYAAQMMAMDASVGMFIDFLGHHRRQHKTALLVTSPRGYALGGHGEAGVGLGLAYSEAMQLPLLVDASSFDTASSRCGNLLDATHLCGMVGTLLGLPASGENDAQSSLQRVAYQSETHRALRTPAWFWRQAIGDPASDQLFVKPDDRWDANEIADRCPDIVDEMRSALNEFLDAAARDTLPLLAPLSEHLRA